MAKRMAPDAAAATPDTHVRTGPGTLAGDYLRRFWQPVFHSADLPKERALPLRILGQDFTLYRGAGGAVHLLDPRCPHRGTQLASGWVEDDALRCFYHGWKFDGTGQCIEQPAEDGRFCHKIAIRSYPTQEYLGLIFVHLGDGAAPVFPLHPAFEDFGGFVEIDSYVRNCNYFQNLENALDMSHVGFVHADNRAAFSGIGRGEQLAADETGWGVAYSFTRADGQRRIQQFGMPNVFYMTALPNDPEIGWQESLFWWVPIEDDRHMQFSLHRIPAAGETARRICERRQARRSAIDLAHQTVCEDVLDGRMTLARVDRSRVDLVRLQDDIAQIGQGRIASRGGEHLGRADVGVIAIRKLWGRELAALRDGRALREWRHDPALRPEAWGIAGSMPTLPENAGRGAAIVDIRPHVEVEIQLRALTGAAR